MGEHDQGASTPTETPTDTRSETSAYEIIAKLVNDVLDDERDLVLREEARLIEHTMRTQHPEAHQAFLEAEAPNLYFNALRSALSSRKQHARRSASARQFGDAIRSGDMERITAFNSWRCAVDPSNRQRLISEMTSEDHRFVAQRYASSERTSMRHRMFHEAVAKRVGLGQTTADVFSESELLDLYFRITGERHTAAEAAA
jgi:hypothetical protein